MNKNTSFTVLLTCILLGVWGSAFTILITRLFTDDSLMGELRRKDMKQLENREHFGKYLLMFNDIIQKYERFKFIKISLSPTKYVAQEFTFSNSKIKTPLKYKYY